jgi:hypothetical protein
LVDVVEMERIRRELLDQAEIELIGPLPIFSFLDYVIEPDRPENTSRWGW